MKRILLYAAILSAEIVLLPSCSDDVSNEEPINIQLTRSENAAVKAVNDFAFDLLKETEKNFSAEKPNYIMSPQSVAWCIAMMANGAETGSETLNEILDALNLGNDITIQDVNDYSKKLIEAITNKNGSADVNIANVIYFTDKNNFTPLEDYSNAIKTFYNAESIAHATNESIDSWISKKTDGKTTDFAKNTNADQYDFGILNTILFEGKWEKLFDTSKTKNREFHNADGTTSTPLMMNSGEGIGCQISNDDICDVLKLFFNKKYFSITFIIPNKEHKFAEILPHLNGETWQNIESNFYLSSRTVIMPKLNLKSEFDFKDVLKDMGIKKAFSEESEFTGFGYGYVQGGFSNIIIPKILNQQSLLTLDEDGVKAKTTTNKSGDLYVSAAWNNYFELDEPFYYFITEESTGAILFAGKVSQL